MKVQIKHNPTYGPGTILRMIWTKDNDVNVQEKEEILAFIIQIDKNQFLLIDALKGNRWYKKPIKGNNETIEHNVLINYLKSTNIFEFEILGNLNQIDFESQAYIVEGDD